MSFDTGDTSKEYARTFNDAGVLADPTTLTLVVTAPNGTTSTYTWAGGGITRESAGVFYREIPLTAAGVYTLDWDATGPAQSETRYLVVGIRVGLCDEWVGAADLFDCAPCAGIDAADRDYGRAALAADAASRLLYLLSNRRYPGVCQDTVRPCALGGWSETWLSARRGHPGGWVGSWGRCGCSSFQACVCGGRREITLGVTPLLQVTEVLVDGVALATTAYRVDGEQYLRRIDGQAWPASQDLDEATTEPNTFSVSFLWGREPPASGILAAKRLACELYRACSSGGDDCVLSDKAVSLISQGVEIALLNPEDLLEKGRTGIKVVDLFLESERYGHRNLSTLTVSPDSLATVRRT